MARGKYEAKKRGADDPPASVGRGTGHPSPVGGALLPAGGSPGSAGGRAGPPVFGIVVVGLCITFLLDGHSVIGYLWAFIAVAWGFFTFRLWRMHLAWDLDN
jgi:hypothetical protein